MNIVTSRHISLRKKILSLCRGLIHQTRLLWQSKQFKKIFKSLPKISPNILIGIFIVIIFLASLFFVKSPPPKPPVISNAPTNSLYLFETKNKNFSAKIGSKNSSAPLVSFTTPSGSTAVFSLTNSESKTAKKENNSIIYPDIYPNTSVTYTPLADGIKEEIIITKPTTKADYTFVLDTKAHPRNIANDFYSPFFFDDKNKYQFHLEKPFAIDAKGARTEDISLSLRQSKKDSNSYQILLSVSSSWLSSKDRVYPVTIDPTIVHNTTAQFATGLMDRIKDLGTGYITGATGGAITYVNGYAIHTFTSGTSSFTPATSGNIEVLVVAGGGGGGSYVGGGGGGGGVYQGTIPVSASTPYTITVGAGGSGGTGVRTDDETNGGNSSIVGGAINTVAIGGGIGKRFPDQNGIAGGSGGGAGGCSAGGGLGGAAQQPGSTTGGYGNRGGNMSGSRSGNDTEGRGGGGAGGIGLDNACAEPGDGGPGIASSITGTTYYYGGGGGGGGYYPADLGTTRTGNGGIGGGGGGGAFTNGTPGTGGTGGTTNGQTPTLNMGAAGQGIGGAGGVNTGGGGGGCGHSDKGGNGGSGIVIVRYPVGPSLTSSFQELPADQYTVGLWHLNEASGNALDSSGYGNTGTPTGTTVTSGLLGNARSFAGGTDTITINNVNVNTTAGASNTVEFWMKWDGTVGKMPFGWNTSYDLYFNSASCFGINTGAGEVLGTTQTIPINSWIHVAAIFYNGIPSPTNSKLYINGVDQPLSYCLGSTGGSRTATSTVKISGWGSDASYKFSGFIDEVRISNVARSAEQIKSDASRRPSAVFTSPVVDIGGPNSWVTVWNPLSWVESGVNTGDGETLFDNTGLIAQWNFNNTSNTTTATNDAGSCGASCNGTLTNMGIGSSAQDNLASSGWTSNNRRWGGGALMFDGTDDYVTTPNNATLNPTTITLETWFKPNNFTTVQNIIDKRNAASTDINYLLQAQPTTGKIRFYSGTGSKFDLYSNASIQLSTWNHIVATYDGSSAKIYFNGKLDTSVGYVGSLSTTTDNSLYICRHGVIVSGYNCNGTLDSTRIYNRALTPDEVLSNYQAGNVELQTRVGNTATPDDGTWEAWRPVTNETQILSLDSDKNNWGVDQSTTNPESCQDILDLGLSTGDGTYTIQLGGQPVSVYCDMTTNGGGWTLVANIAPTDGNSVGYNNQAFWTTPAEYGSFANKFSNDYKSPAAYSLPSDSLMIQSTNTGSSGSILGWRQWPMQNRTFGSFFTTGIVAVHTIDSCETGNSNAVFLGTTSTWDDIIRQGNCLYSDVNPSSSGEGDTIRLTTIPYNSTDNNMAGFASCIDCGTTWQGATYPYMGLDRAACNNFTCTYATICKMATPDCLGNYCSATYAATAGTCSTSWNSRFYVKGKSKILAKANATTTKIEGSGALQLTTGRPEVDSNTVCLWHLDETDGTGAYLKDQAGYYPPNATGGTISYTNGYTIHTFTSGTSTFTPTTSMNIETLVVGGGGGGGETIGGGGGGGAVIYSTSSAVVAGNNYTVTVGAGGGGGNDGQNSVYPGGASGTASSIIGTGVSITAPAGGGGGGYNQNGTGAIGANGGGQGAGGGAGIGPGGGYNAGGTSGSNANSAAGGGGQWTVGTNSTSGAPGAGGSGVGNTISGITQYYGAGGGGGARNPGGGTGAAGGSGVGGTGGTGGANGPASAGTAGVVNSGSGGGGGGYTNVNIEGPGGNGGSGVVIIRYPSSYSASKSYNNGTPTGTSSTQGVTGKARNFNGSSDKITINGDVFAMATNLTLEAWIKPNTIAAGARDIADNVNTWDYRLYQSGADLGMQVSLDDGNTGYHSATNVLVANKWHYVVGTFDGNNVKMYVDGVLKTNDVATGTIKTPGSGLVVGSYGSGEWFSGAIDEVRVSNIARTAEEIAESYRQGRDHYVNKTIASTDLSGKTTLPFYVAADRPGSYLTATLGESNFANYQPDANTIGLWHLDEQSGSGAYIKDASGNGNSGTPTGTTSTQGKIGKARNYNGTSDFISLGSLSSGTAGTTEAWINPSGVYNNAQVVVSGGASNGADASSRYSIVARSTGACASGDWLTTIANGSTAQYVCSGQIFNSSNFPAGVWTYLVVTYDGSNVKFYKDGSLVSKFTQTVSGAGAAQPVSIGRYGAYNGATSFYFSGSVDEVRLSNIARTADDIRQAYEVGLRSHPITIDFNSAISHTNIISSAADLSFTLMATPSGTTNAGDNIFPGDKIIVKQNYDGTDYIAQGTVTSVNVSTGATAVASWDTGSTFPSIGFGPNSTVFKWQREYWNIRHEAIGTQMDALTNLTLRVTDGNEGRNIWLDDLRSNTDYLTASASSTITSSTLKRYFQYRSIISSFDEAVSASMSAVTMDYIINTAPTPTLDFPTDTATNISLIAPVFKTTATDADGDYLRYKIEACTDLAMTVGCITPIDQTSSQTGWSNQNTQSNTAYTSGTQATHSATLSLLPSTTYFWRTYAKDPAGTNTWGSTQATPRSFTTSNSPTAPTTPYTEGATNPTGIITVTPKFSAIHNDPDGDSANKYEIQVNSNNTFTGTNLWTSSPINMPTLVNASRSADFSYAGTALPLDGAGTTYYWRIRFTDVNGAVGAWSATQSFTMNLKPIAPTLNTPASASATISTTPTLTTIGTDPDGDYLRYKIRLCTDYAMTASCQTYDQTSSQTGWTGQDTQTSTAYLSGTTASFTVQTPLLPNTTYYWKSYAIDPGGSNTWGPTQTAAFSFTTRLIPDYPNSCTATKAGDNSSITINWIDPSTTENGYQIWKVTDNGIPVHLLPDLAANTFTYLDNAILVNHRYGYLVRSFENDGTNILYSNWCTVPTTNTSSGNFKMEGLNLNGLKIN